MPTQANMPTSVMLTSAIVNQAAIKHGAFLQIESEPGKPTSFSVNFPTYRCLREAPTTAQVFHLSDY